MIPFCIVIDGHRVQFGLFRSSFDAIVYALDCGARSASAKRVTAAGR
ncbi:hypothetical protein [Cupriavidus gilardii]|nr:hypothetical protein [Cupriavidus gilardii]